MIVYTPSAAGLKAVMVEASDCPLLGGQAGDTELRPHALRSVVPDALSLKARLLPVLSWTSRVVSAPFVRLNVRIV